MGFILAHVTSFQVFELVTNITIILDSIVGNARHTCELMIAHSRKGQNNGTVTFHVN